MKTNEKPKKPQKPQKTKKPKKPKVSNFKLHHQISGWSDLKFQITELSFLFWLFALVFVYVFFFSFSIFDVFGREVKFLSIVVRF